MNKAKLHAALLKVRDKRIYPSFGICSNLHAPYGCGYSADDLLPMFRRWKYFSGDIAYPVTASRPTWLQRLRVKYFWHAIPYSKLTYRTMDKWDTNTEYGRLRMELLDFMISETSD